MRTKLLCIHLGDSYPASARRRIPAIIFLFSVLSLSSFASADDSPRTLDGPDLDASIAHFENKGSALTVSELSRLAGLYFIKADRSTDDSAKDYFIRAKNLTDRAIRDDPGRAEALYWRAMAGLALTSRSRSPKGYLDVRSAIRDLELARAKDSVFDYSGASRTLGRILDEAPAWSLLQNRKKSLSYLGEAVENSPDFPLNRLYLAEALIHSGRNETALIQLRWIVDHVEAGSGGDDGIIRNQAERLLGKLRKIQGDARPLP
jgi:tetratricopeptide (TPR) repeat protein